LIENVGNKKSFKEKKVCKKPIPKKTGTKHKAGATKDRMENLTEQVKLISVNDNGSDESEAKCPSCGLIYGCVEDNEMWICCDWCGQWWDIGCTTIRDGDNIPDEFVCSECN